MALFLDDGRALRRHVVVRQGRRLVATDDTDVEGIRRGQSDRFPSAGIELVGDAGQVAEGRVLGIRREDVGVADRHQLLQRQIRFRQTSIRIPAAPLLPLPDAAAATFRRLVKFIQKFNSKFIHINCNNNINSI